MQYLNSFFGSVRTYKLHRKSSICYILYYTDTAFLLLSWQEFRDDKWRHMWTGQKFPHCDTLSTQYVPNDLVWYKHTEYETADRPCRGLSRKRTARYIRSLRARVWYIIVYYIYREKAYSLLMRQILIVYSFPSRENYAASRASRQPNLILTRIISSRLLHFSSLFSLSFSSSVTHHRVCVYLYTASPCLIASIGKGF